ncbi:MAG: hypothetical protein ABJN11_14740 [Lentilitoribacter sp.]
MSEPISDMPEIASLVEECCSIADGECVPDAVVSSRTGTSVFC